MAEPSLSEFMRWNDQTPVAYGLKWCMAVDHQSRVSILEKCLNFAYGQLTDARRHNQGFSEDAFNTQVVSILAAHNIVATHDGEVGGHCDVLVRAAGDFLWIGEAKIYNGAAYISGGFEQLSSRYGAAQPGRDHGEIIIYCRSPNISVALQRWREHLLANFDGVEILVEDAPDPRHFKTRHSCHNTGLPIYVRHRIVPLHHNPTR